MEQSVITSNAFFHVAWGAPISVYFWLVGASAGSFVISAFAWVFGIKRYKPISMIASVQAIVMLLIVPLILIADLGKPWRFIYLLLPANWHGTAPMSWGAMLILSYPVSMFIYTYFCIKNNQKWAKILGIVAIVLACSTHWYTGVVMELNPGRHLNHTAMAPILFLTGAFISGIGVLILIISIYNKVVSAAKRIDWNLVEEMATYMKYGIGFDAFLLWCEFLQTVYGRESEYSAHHYILGGVFYFPYVWLETIIGLVIPFAILCTPLKKTKAGVITAAFLVAIGVYGMRIWWVLGGQYMQQFY